jgi:hypothetical protein
MMGISDKMNQSRLLVYPVPLSRRHTGKPEKYRRITWV